MPSQITIVLAALVLAVAACGPGVTPGTDTTTEAAVTTSTPVESGTADREDLLVVATTSILGDVVANVLGDAGRVEVLMPIGTDAHDFQPSAQQVALIGEADLVVANGLGLEEGLVGVLEAAQAEGGNVLELADLLDPIPFAEEHDDHAEEETEHDDEEGDHGHGDEDPHFWFDPVRVAEAARIVAHRLAELDEGGSADQWDERAEAYAAEILAIDDQIRALLDPILNRRLVTNHDVLGYFADRYDFEVIGVVIP
ncbi:MAG: metal ABC transporter substrate-binding protein, partial [Acidimicrobiia bacterium]